MRKIMPEIKENLRPCPACGNTKVIMYELDGWNGIMGVKCSDLSCGLSTGAFALNGKRAIELWNSMPRRCPVCLAATNCYDTSCRNCGRMLPWMKDKCEEKSEDQEE